VIKRSDYEVKSFFSHSGGPCGWWNVTATISYLVGIAVQVSFPFVGTVGYTGFL
jgi:hypothetical protein